MYHQITYHNSVCVADNLYFYVWQGQGNSCNTCLLPHVLAGEHPHALIDPGLVVDEVGEACLDSLIKSLEQDGFRAEDIGLIINTHAHPDHCGANQALLEKTRKTQGETATQALIALGKDEAEYRREIGKKIGGLSRAMQGMQSEPSFYLTEGELVLEGVSLHILHTPGHTPGSINIYCPDSKALISGDLVFYGAVGRTDFPGGSPSMLKRSIEKVSALEVEYLLPGHSTQFGSLVRGRDRVRRNFQVVQSLF